MAKDINLIPDRVINKKRHFLRNSAKIFALIFAVFLLGFAAYYKTFQRWELEEELNSARRLVNNERLDELKTAEQRLKDVTQELKKLEQIIQVIPQDEIRFGDILNKTLGLKPEAVMLDSMQFNRDINELSLSLRAIDRKDFSLYLKRLHDQPFYPDIRMSSVTGNNQDYRCTIWLSLTGESNRFAQ